MSYKNETINRRKMRALVKKEKMFMKQHRFKAKNYLKSITMQQSLFYGNAKNRIRKVNEQGEEDPEQEEQLDLEFTEAGQSLDIMEGSFNNNVDSSRMPQASPMQFRRLKSDI